MLKAVLSIDVEHTFEAAPEGVHAFLDLLGELGIRATFFCTTSVLERNPDVIRALRESPHEIASHGAHHSEMDKGNKQCLTQLEPSGIPGIIEESKAAFDREGIEIKGFRAMSLQTNPLILSEVEKFFDYDSSLLSRVPPHIDPATPKLVRVPVTRLMARGMPYSSSALMGMGPAALAAAAHTTRGLETVVCYAHCFDLAGCPVEGLNVAGWKKQYYYRRCGPSQKAFFTEWVKQLRAQGRQFLTCAEIANAVPGQTPSDTQ
ncbi:MAG: polysaccharide deacetylase family protein [Candidatus Omnitrophica bacterium]|nr:polysaccharide deacetylase family protein [Candidatus Omnitrophota bacterium]